MKKKWALPVPLHLAAHDYSPDACELRLHLYQSTFERVGGKGFRVAQTKRLRSRVRYMTRVDRLWYSQQFGGLA